MDYHFRMRYITMGDVSKKSTPAVYPHFWFFLSTSVGGGIMLSGCQSDHLSVFLSVYLSGYLHYLKISWLNIVGLTWDYHSNHQMN